LATNPLADKFESSENGVFRFIRGPANDGGPAPCQWKLCITATDEEYLVTLIYEISQRQDCFFVKYSPSSSPKSRDKMMLGRIFLTTEDKIGELWQALYKDKKLMCSIQDDCATERFRAR